MYRDQLCPLSNLIQQSALEALTLLHGTWAVSRPEGTSAFLLASFVTRGYRRNFVHPSDCDLDHTTYLQGQS